MKGKRSNGPPILKFMTICMREQNGVCIVDVFPVGQPATMAHECWLCNLEDLVSIVQLFAKRLRARLNQVVMPNPFRTVMACRMMAANGPLTPVAQDIASPTQ